MDENVSMTETTLEKITFMAERQIRAGLARDFSLEPQVRVYADGWLDSLVISVRQSVLSQELNKISVSYPAGWWQAVKERFAPKWFLSRWPVRHERTVIDVRAIYPKMALPNEISYPVARILVSGAAIIEGAR